MIKLLRKDQITKPFKLIKPYKKHIKAYKESNRAYLFDAKELQKSQNNSRKSHKMRQQRGNKTTIIKVNKKTHDKAKQAILIALTKQLQAKKNRQLIGIHHGIHVLSSTQQYSQMMKVTKNLENSCSISARGSLFDISMQFSNIYESIET